jgi:cytochrome P450
MAQAVAGVWTNDVRRAHRMARPFGGGGVHFSPSTSLARLELRELIGQILERGISIELACTPRFVHSNFVNGIEHLDMVAR